MNTGNTTADIEWFDLIVIMNSLISNVEKTQHLTFERRCGRRPGIWFARRASELYESFIKNKN